MATSDKDYAYLSYITEPNKDIPDYIEGKYHHKQISNNLNKYLK